MPRTPPGETRERVFQYVRERLMKGRSPTIREVQQALGFRAVETARAHLTRLVEDGQLVKRGGESRGFDLPLPDGTHPPRLAPILGRVQAGALSTAIEDPEGYVPIEAARAGDEIFALRVRGESMTGAGIFPDDLVIVRRQPTARSGEIVVALVEDEATVKRLQLKGRRVELHPENPAFEIIVPPRDACTILGKVIEVRRKL